MGPSRPWWWQLRSAGSAQKCSADLWLNWCCDFGRWKHDGMGQSRPRWWQLESSRSAHLPLDARAESKKSSQFQAVPGEASVPCITRASDSKTSGLSFSNGEKKLQQRRVPGCRLVASSWLFNRWAIFSVTYNSSAGWKNPWVQDSELDSIVTRNERRQWFIKLYTRLYTIYQNKCLPWNMYPRDLISLIFWHRSKTGYSSLLDAGSMSDHSLRFSFKISLPLSLYTWYMYKLLGCDWLFHRPNPFPSCDDRWFYPLRWWGNVATRISRWRGTSEWCVLLVLWE